MRSDALPRGPARLRGEAGQVGGMEVLPFGFLVFVSGTLLFVNVWGVIDAKFAVTSASREAVRAYVEADTEADAHAAALARGEETLVAYGRDGRRATIADPRLDDRFGRCTRVSITVAYEVPVIAIPWLGGFGRLDAVESTASEIIDPYRDGLAGSAAC